MSRPLLARVPAAAGPLLPALVLLVACAAQAKPPTKPAAPPPGPTSLPAVKPDATTPRAAIPAVYKWQLAPLLKDEAAFAALLKQSAADRAALAECQGKLGDARRLVDCLERYFRARVDANRLTLYANLLLAADGKSTTAKTLSEQSLKGYDDFMAATGFFRVELAALGDDAYAALLAGEPRLAAYRPYLDEMRRRRARMLAPDSERILGLLGDNQFAEIDLNELPSDFQKTHGALMTDLVLPRVVNDAGEEVQLTVSGYPRLRASSERWVRREAVERFLATLRGQQDVFAAALAGQVRLSVGLARARGYSTALQAYLDRDNIDPAVYTTLVAAVRQNLRPLHRYVALRKRVLGVSAIHLYDLYTPLVPSVDLTFTYADARRVLPEALAPLGPEYVKILDHGLDVRNGWLDLYPSQDKESGAFCSSVYGVHPFVKMNYYDSADDLSTLAHEYGHALHSYLAMQRQPVVTAGYPPFVAEIASTFNEKLLSDYLLKNAKSDDERLTLLAELLETLRTTIYRQTLFAEFELAVHTAAEKGEPLGAETMNRIYGELLRAYYGPDYTIGKNDEVEWAYIPHLFYKYYVFAYADGLAAGIALAEKVAAGDAAARDAYLAMLAAGSSLPPVELVRRAGVDLARPDAIAAAARLMDRTIDEIEAILAKRARP